jgi:hypothetical protein
MCNFASFVLTKTHEYFSLTSNNHTDIIEQHKLREMHPNGIVAAILKVEITPPEDDPRAPLEKWDFVIDQDIRPEWFDDEDAEKRTRAALARRATDERWLVDEICDAGHSSTVGYAGTATAGDAGTATAGYAGTATAGARGTATAGDAGTATAGARGTAAAGDAGTATAGARGTATAGARGTAAAGDAGTATAGYAGTATAGYAGTATAGDAGTATAGDAGTATAGDAGTATAGDDAEIRIRYWDPKCERYRTAVAYTGEDGIEPNTAYILDEAHKFVRKS